MSNLGKRLLMGIAGSVICWSANAQQIPAPTLATTYSQGRAFFGGRSAKMVVSMTLSALSMWDQVDKRAAHLYLVDFSKNPLSLERITDSARVLCGDPAISPDGTRIVYGGSAAKDCGALYVCRAEKGGAGKVLLAASGFSPSWWIHPTTGDEYVIWVSTPPNGEGGIAGVTYIRKMKRGTTEPLEPQKILIDKYALRFGRSVDGKYICTNFPGWHMAELKLDAVENAFVRFVFQGGRACMGNTSRDPADPNNMLWCWLGHKEVAYDIWNPREFAPFPAPYTSVQYNRWSNHADFASECLLNNPDGGTNEYNAALNAAAAYRISTAQWLVVTKGSRATSLWVEPRPARAVPSIAVENRSLPASRSHAWVFTQKAAVTLSCPDNSQIVYTFNDTLPLSSWTKYAGAIPITTTCALTARSLSPDTSRFDHSSSSRMVFQKCPWFDGVVFGTPPDENSVFGGRSITDNRQFQGAYDGSSGRYFKGRNGGALRAADVFTGIDAGVPRTLKEVHYSTTNNTGHLPGSVVQGSNETWDNGYVNIVTIATASPLTIQSDRAYRFYRVVFDTNCSGIGELKFVLGDQNPLTVQAPSISPHGGTFDGSTQVSISTITAGADVFYTTNGIQPSASSTRYSAPFTISTNTTVKAIAIKDGNKSPIDSAAFMRAALMTKPVAFTPAGAVFKDSVLVTLSSLTQGAKIHYTLDGTNPSASSQVYAGKPLAVKQTTLIKAQASNDGMSQSEISMKLFLTKADSASGGAGRLIQQSAGVSYGIGDTMPIRWMTYDPDVFNAAELQFSSDGGKSYRLILESNDINIADNQWGYYKWVIPPTLDDQPVTSSQCLIRIVQYNGSEIDRSAAFFSIGTVGVRESYRSESFVSRRYIETGNSGRIVISGGSAAASMSVELFDICGRSLTRISGHADKVSAELRRVNRSRGIYLVRVR